MRTLDSYLGINPFTVLVDDSPELNNLVAKARDFSALPFAEKLAAVKALAIEAMANAYEGMINGNELHRQIVLENKPLSFALKNMAGCCRYQGALFFVLGYEASLGDKHFIQAATISGNVRTVFNDVYDSKKRFPVSIFAESLGDKRLDYTAARPDILASPISIPGRNFYSYHRTKNNLTLIENPNEHARSLD